MNNLIINYTSENYFCCNCSTRFSVTYISDLNFEVSRSFFCPRCDFFCGLLFAIEVISLEVFYL